MRQGRPLSPLLRNTFMDSLALQVIEACAAKGVHGSMVAFRISGQVVSSPSEELGSMLMSLYSDGRWPPTALTSKRPSRSRSGWRVKWGMADN